MNVKAKKNKEWFYSRYGKSSDIDEIIDIYNRLMYSDDEILTSFLDPAQRYILNEVIGQASLIQSYGGYKDSERRRVYLSSNWNGILPDDFEIVPLEIEYPSKFISLRHSDILGTLANSGVSLNTFGDIIGDGMGRWQFFVKKDLAVFFTDQISRIGKNKVRIKQISPKEVLVPEDNSIEVTAIVSSMRLDAILSSLSKQSRVQIKQLIEGGQAKLNWLETKNSNIIVKVNDIISLRHLGRAQVLDVQATKKGKLKVVLKFWQAKRNK
ncbi:RNA-binding protein [Lactobacillus pasteurii]|uniref:S4 domain protein n=1 Tax=Lactobacillus pasteurii DSM 23907 = CRBIP 24.76 TaxID=1423790 RepID=I7KLJ3_9LACO|nr:YlmH/Sll1252 family protein [Lactobacillus pasteurii]TDG76489.1 hypothetical protein C5L33_001248 [Lactobacillus pasteurii]CCI85419.1 S4 domain protein [Lactobacillus pasteurii DSM 23907 = CRBIP 24.76]